MIEGDGNVGLAGVDGGAVAVGDGAERIGGEEMGALLPGVVGVDIGVGGTVDEGGGTVGVTAGGLGKIGAEPAGAVVTGGEDTGVGADGGFEPVEIGVDGLFTGDSCVGIAAKSFSPQPRNAKGDKKSRV